jgi:alpha-tubulin suppressor-like RCC1 family protein
MNTNKNLEMLKKETSKSEDKNFLNGLKRKFNKTFKKRWQKITVISLLVALILGLIGFGIWQLLRDQEEAQASGISSYTLVLPNEFRDVLDSKLSTISGLTKVQKGVNFYIALNSQGQVYTWGSNTFGQLGYTTTETFSEDPLIVDSLPGIKEVFAGRSTAYAIAENGKVYAWGDNICGLVGNGQFSTQPSLSGTQEINDVTTPTQITIGGDQTTIKKLSLGRSHAMALSDSGNIYTWGCNSFGQLGNGQSDGQSLVTTPTQISLDENRAAQDISAGDEFSVALADGIVYTWGSDSNGQLGRVQNLILEEVPTGTEGGSTEAGNTETTNSEENTSPLDFNPNPGFIPQISGEITKISTGQNFLFFSKDDNRILATGANDAGQLANEDYKTGVDLSVIPTQFIPGAGPIVSKAGEIIDSDIAGFSSTQNRTYLLTKNGNIYTWGSDSTMGNDPETGLPNFDEPQLFGTINDRPGFQEAISIAALNIGVLSVEYLGDGSVASSSINSSSSDPTSSSSVDSSSDPSSSIDSSSTSDPNSSVSSSDGSSQTSQDSSSTSDITSSDSSTTDPASSSVGSSDSSSSSVSSIEIPNLCPSDQAFNPSTLQCEVCQNDGCVNSICINGATNAPTCSNFSTVDAIAIFTDGTSFSPARSNAPVFKQNDLNLTINPDSRFTKNGTTTAVCQFRIKEYGKADNDGTRGIGLTETKLQGSGSYNPNSLYYEVPYSNANGCSVTFPAAQQDTFRWQFETRVVRSDDGQVFYGSPSYYFLFGALIIIDINVEVL